MNKLFLNSALLVAFSFLAISFPSCSDDKTDDVISTGAESGTEVSIEKTFLSSLIDDEEGQVTNLTYDSENRLITLISKIDSVLQYSVYVNYNADGKIVKSKIIEDSDNGDLEVLKSYTYSKDSIFISYDSSIDTLVVVNNLLQTWRNNGNNITTYKYDTDGDVLETVNRTAGTTETITYNYDNSKKGLSYDGILPSWFSIYNDFDLKEFFTKKRLTQFTQVIDHPKSTPVTYTAIFKYVDVDGKPSKITRYYTFSSSTITNEEPEIASFVLKYQVKK